MQRINGLCLFLAITLGILPGSAHALSDSDKEAVRLLSNQAAAEYEQQHYAPALENFKRAYAIAKVPKIAVWLARVNEKLGRLVTAVDYYREALALVPNDLWRGELQQKAQQVARAELDLLLPRVPKLTITVRGAKTSEVVLTVDGVPVQAELVGVARPLDPGPHDVVATRGNETRKKSIIVDEGTQNSVTLPFDVPLVTAYGKDDAPASSAASGTVPTALAVPDQQKTSTDAQSGQRQRTWGWVGVGLGAAGVALGATTGILVASKNGDLKKQCPGGKCPEGYESDVNSYSRLQTVSTIGFIVGGVFAAAGVTLLLTSPRATPPATVGLWFSPNAAGVKGAF